MRKLELNGRTITEDEFRALPVERQARVVQIVGKRRMRAVLPDETVESWDDYLTKLA